MKQNNNKIKRSQISFLETRDQNITHTWASSDWMNGN
jgi:hypothetical protein